MDMTVTDRQGDEVLSRIGDAARKAEREAAALLRQMTALDRLVRAPSGTGRGLVRELGSGLALAQREMGRLAEMGEKFAGGLDRAFSRAFERFIISGRDARSVLKGLEADLLRLGSRAAMDSLRSPFAGSGGGGGGLFTGLLGGMFSGASSLLRLIPGFATGGSFTVGGAAGIDRNLVPLRLTRGERVTIEPAAATRRREATASAGPVINLNFNITTPDAASFRMSAAQIQGEALRQAQRALRRNG